MMGGEARGARSAHGSAPPFPDPDAPAGRPPRGRRPPPGPQPGGGSPPRVALRGSGCVGTGRADSEVSCSPSLAVSLERRPSLYRACSTGGHGACSGWPALDERVQ